MYVADKKQVMYKVKKKSKIVISTKSGRETIVLGKDTPQQNLKILFELGFTDHIEYIEDKSCVDCGEPLADKRRKKCDNCKSEEKNGSKEE